MGDSTTYVGVGYRLMEKDEPVFEGDEVQRGDGTWRRTVHYIEEKPQARFMRYRRLVTSVAPAPHVTPDAVGWRTRPNGETIQIGDDVRNVVGGTVVVDWVPANALVGYDTGVDGWQARYRITDPEPVMTTARWFVTNDAERHEQQKPAIMAWLNGAKIEGLWSDDVWRERVNLTPMQPLRVKPEVPKLVWSSDVDGLRNTVWRTKGDKLYIVSQLLANNDIRWRASHTAYSFDCAESAKAACQLHCEEEAAR